MDAIDILLRTVAKELGPNPRDPIKRSSVQALLAELARNQPFVKAVRLLDVKTAEPLFDFVSGREVSYEGEKEVWVSPPDGVHVTKPFRDQISGAWLVGVSRVVSAREGIPGNIVVAHVALDYFQRLYDNLNVGEKGSIVLFRSDGILLARRPYNPDDVGRDLSRGELFRTHLPHAPGGTYSAPAATDGVERLVSYHRVDALPLIVLAGLATDEVEAAWRQDMTRNVAIAYILCLTLIGLALVLRALNSRRTAAERALEITLAHMDQGLLMFDEKDVVQVCNQRAVELLDLPADLMASRPRFSDVLEHQKQCGEFSTSDIVMQGILRVGGVSPEHGTYERKRPNGTILEVRTVQLLNGGAVRTFTDVTTQRQIAASARAEQERYRLLADNATDMIFRTALDGRQLYVSPACREVLGYEPRDLIEAGTQSLTHPEDRDVVQAAWQELLDGAVEQQTFRYRWRHKNGQWLWCESRRRIAREPDGTAQEAVSIVRDVSERVALEEQLYDLARTDPLTGLANRRAFEEALETEWSRASRQGSPLALLSLDLDFFKQYNDHFGHGPGDSCLRQLAVLLAANRRISDVAARVGGEEFALLLPGTDARGARAVAEAIRSELERVQIPHPRSSHQIVTASIGFAALRPAAGGTTEDLRSQSDQAMYLAKELGRNRVEGSYPKGGAARRAVQVSRRLKASLRRDRVNGAGGPPG
jgi:diguanylate cyclase (GGDEF)-like protein/PAS domain S-box-containing protein